MAFFAAIPHRLRPALFTATILCSSLAVGQMQKTTSTSKSSADKLGNFGGSYDTLLPPQQRLVDEYFQRASAALGSRIDPATAYNNLQLSVRSTYDAITHALTHTQLTGSDGKKYGTALDLVDIVEEVAGERKGARGDQQYRMYVLLKPNAYNVLSKVKQFNHEHDNTIYHQGYPICFRSVPAVPSIQFSITADHQRADIDVDYRSSKFPAAIVDGHLTASNSDVRSGSNLERHDHRWSGLSGWWRSLFGLPPMDLEAMKSWVQETVPTAPKGDPDQLTHDFLTSWLVNENIGAAGAYFSQRVYPCAEERAREQGRNVRPGIGKFLVLMELANGAKIVGKIDTLSSVVSAPENPYDQLKSEKNKYESEFLLLQVPPDEAAEFLCTSATGKTVAANGKEEKDKENYVASLVRIKPSQGAPVVLMLLWGKELKEYRVVSARMIDAGGPTFAAYSGKWTAARANMPMPTVEGDIQLNATLETFFTTWLLKNNAQEATTYFASGSYSCMPPEKASRGARALVESMNTIRKQVGARQSLQDYLEPVVPNDPQLKRVVHVNDKAYTIVTMPGTEAQTFSCSKTKKLPANGSYYGNVFRFRTTNGNDPATLYVIWGKETDGWKVVAWRVISAG